MEYILNEFKNENNILLGVCDASRMDYLIPVLKAAKTPFVGRDIERRINPQAIMPDAKSIIVVGVGARYAASTGGIPLTGRLSTIAVAPDYHCVITSLLNVLAARMAEKQPFKHMIFVDAGHLNERALAVKAGLGFSGKNGLVISERFGSFFNIGYMLTDLELAPNEQIKPQNCGDCRRCIDSCSGRALGISCNAQKCVSYLTQKKSDLTPDEARTIGNWLYGCDVCQNVCPFNHTEPVECRSEDMYPSLLDCIEISSEEFDRKYKDSSLYWRGVEVFRRNARIALNNVQDV